jgi:hypothetical protein
VVSPEFHQSTLAQTQRLDRALNNEPESRVPLSLHSPVRNLDFASQGQSTSGWDMGTGHYRNQAGNYISGEGGSMHNRAPECGQCVMRTQTPDLPVPSISSPPPICTCASYGNLTSHLAYSMPVPTYVGSHTALFPPSPAAEVTASRYEEWHALPMAYVSHLMPSPPTPQDPLLLDTIARINSTPTTFTSDLRSPHPHRGPDRSATFAGTPSYPASGFPVPQFHSPYHPPTPESLSPEPSPSF